MADKKKTGRLSSYTDELADAICLRISDGETLSAVCLDAGMPSRGTVYDWVDRHPHFATKYAHARERQAECHADEILAASALPGDATSNMINAARLRVDALKWTASKLRPARYGDKLLTALTDVDGQDLDFTITFVPGNRIEPKMVDVTPESEL